MNDDTQRQKRVVNGLRIAVAVVILLIIGMGVMLKVKSVSSKNVTLQASPEKPLAVQVITIHTRQMADIMVIPGRIEAFARVRLSAETSGRIVDLPVNKGARVEAGQTLLKVDSRSASDMMKQADIMKKQAERDIARLSELKKTGAISDSDLEAAKKGGDLAAVAFDEASVRLSQCEIKSPMAGVINDRYVELGEYANPGMPVFDIVNSDKVKLTLNIPERDVLDISVDRALTFEVNSVPGREFVGKVSFVASAADKDRNTFACEILSDNSDRVLRPGMIARVSLPRRDTRLAMVVPMSAVVPQKGDYVVFAIENGRAARKLVKIDEILGSDAILTEGVKENDVIAVEGARALVDGMPVNVLAADGSATAKTTASE